MRPEQVSVSSNHVIPALSEGQIVRENWFPAYAGMTNIAALKTFGKLFGTAPVHRVH